MSNVIIYHFTANRNPFCVPEHIQVFIVLGMHNFAFAIEGKAIYLSAKTDY